MGVRARRVEGYYQDLLNSEAKSSDDKEIDSTYDIANKPQGCANEKWKRQIEKVSTLWCLKYVLQHLGSWIALN